MGLASKLPAGQRTCRSLSGGSGSGRRAKGIRSAFRQAVSVLPGQKAVQPVTTPKQTIGSSIDLACRIICGHPVLIGFVGNVQEDSLLEFYVWMECTVAGKP